MGVWILRDFIVFYFLFLWSVICLSIGGYTVVMLRNKGKADLILTKLHSFPPAVVNTNIIVLYMHSYNLKL